MKKEWNNTLFRLGFGKFVIPEYPADSGFDDAAKERISWLLQYAYEHGINVVECYSPHGEAAYKTIIGKVIKPFRDDVCLLDRISIRSIQKPGDLYQACVDSLNLLETDYVDYYSLEDFDEEIIKDETYFQMILDDVKRLKQEGLICYSAFMGMSDHEETTALIDNAAAYGVPFEAMLCEYNLIKQHMSYSLAAAKRRGLRTFALSATADDKLTHELSFRFVWSNPNVDILMAANVDEKRIQRNLQIESQFRGAVAAPEKSLWYIIADEIDGIRRISRSNCGDCRACMPCEAGIPIFDWLELCKKYINEPDNVRVSREIERFFLEYGNPVTKCIHCRKCESQCPQKLPITKFMKKAVMNEKVWREHLFSQTE